MKKQKTQYQISITDYGHVKVVFSGSRKGVDKWLFNYFTIGEEKWWAWDRFQELNDNPRKKFTQYVKEVIKDRYQSTIQVFHLRPHKIILVKQIG